MQRGFTLPSPDFAYGRPNVAKDGGAIEAHDRLDTNCPHFQPDLEGRQKEKRDQKEISIALNKACIGSGLVTAKEQFEYRATHDVRRRVSEDEMSKTKIRRIPANMTFGVSTR